MRDQINFTIKSPQKSPSWVCVAILVMGVIGYCCDTHNGPGEHSVGMAQNENFVSKYDLLELTFEYNGNYTNKFFDVNLNVNFVSPSGVQYHVKGFYYNGDIYKARFRPNEPGLWQYSFIIFGNDGFSEKGDGRFECKNSLAKGWVMRHPKNPFRWVFTNGDPYFPVGLQDCVNYSDKRINKMFVDGDETRHNPKVISPEEYLSIYGKAGFNLLRFSQQNCSLRLYDDLDHYLVSAGIAVDSYLETARQNGFRIMFGFFGFPQPRNRIFKVFRRVKRRVLQAVFGSPQDLGNLSKEERFVDYCIARWGVYADFWELLNEQNPSDEWVTQMASYVRSVDPDHKPITTSYEKPYLAVIDINAPHWYESESEFSSDLRVRQRAEKWKKAGKPVIVGEQGNTGMNWDERSALRMRTRIWTALFQEISLVFWNTSWSKKGMNQGTYIPGTAANIYLGPEERSYIRVFRDFCSRLPADVRMAPVQVSLPNKVRAYGLRSQTVLAVYLHHFDNHTDSVGNLRISVNFPHATGHMNRLLCEWIDPSNGSTLEWTETSPDQQWLDVPAFKIDLALLITFASV